MVSIDIFGIWEERVGNAIHVKCGAWDPQSFKAFFAIQDYSFFPFASPSSFLSLFLLHPSLPPFSLFLFLISLLSFTLDFTLLEPSPSLFLSLFVYLFLTLSLSPSSSPLPPFSLSPPPPSLSLSHSPVKSTPPQSWGRSWCLMHSNPHTTWPSTCTLIMHTSAPSSNGLAQSGGGFPPRVSAGVPFEAPKHTCNTLFSNVFRLLEVIIGSGYSVWLGSNKSLI